MRPSWRPAWRTAQLGLELGWRLAARQPLSWAAAGVGGVLLGFSAGLASEGPAASAGLYAEFLVATALTVSWLIALRLAPQVRAPDHTLLGASPGGLPPVHPRWVVGGVAGGICQGLLLATAVMVAVGMALEPGQWSAVAPALLPAGVLAWMGGCSLALWVLILGGSLSRSLVLVLTLGLLLLDLAPPDGPGAWALGTVIFPVSPVAIRVDEWAGNAAPLRWLAAGACHLLGLWILLLLTTPRHTSTRS